MTRELGHRGIPSSSTIPPRPPGVAPVRLVAHLAACFTIPCGRLRLGNRPRIPARTPLPTITCQTLAPLRLRLRHLMESRRVGNLPLRRSIIILPQSRIDEMKRVAQLGNHASSRWRIPKKRASSGTLLKNFRIGYRSPLSLILIGIEKDSHARVV